MASDLFASMKRAINAKVRDQATSARERLQAISEKVLHEVVESEVFKKHVAFNVEDFIGLGPEEIVDAPREHENAQIEVEPLGFVTVSVSRLAGVKSNVKEPYIEVCFEGDIKRTQIGSKVSSSKGNVQVFQWDEPSATLTFAVRNLKTAVAIRVMDENVVSVDEHIGQVVIPIERLLPSIVSEVNELRKPEEERETKFTEGPLVYEIYPLPKDRLKFLPAVKNVSNTGMSRPSSPLGYLRVKTELVITNVSSPLKILRLYALRPEAIRRRVKRTPFDNVTLDVARVQRHVQRQLKRLENIAQRILVGPFPPTLALSYSRSWQSPVFSASFILCTSAAILYLPSYLMPMYYFVILSIGSYLARSQGEEPPVIWNEDIRDPDDALNPMQRLSKLLWVLETISESLVGYADFFERIIHAYGFRDERASAILLMMTFGTCLLMSFLAYFVSFRMIVFLLYNVWNFAPCDFEKIYKKKAASIQTGKPPIDPNVLYNIMIPFSRVPTTEHIGHLEICYNQIVQDKDIIEQVERDLCLGQVEMDN